MSKIDCIPFDCWIETFGNAELLVVSFEKITRSFQLPQPFDEEAARRTIGKFELKSYIDDQKLLAIKQVLQGKLLANNG